MFKAQRKAYKHEISTQEDLDFLVQWIKSMCEIEPSIRGRVNSYSINFTGKFVAIDNTGTLSIEKVESWND